MRSQKPLLKSVRVQVPLPTPARHLTYCFKALRDKGYETAFTTSGCKTLSLYENKGKLRKIYKYEVILMFGFNMFETFEVELEIYIADKLVQKQTMQAPKEILIANFMQLAQQIRNDSRPMKIKISRPETIWDNFENKEKVLNQEVIASNDAMIAYEEEKQKGDT